jgi:membrane carboxypeptidase/penicillin-binding protein
VEPLNKTGKVWFVILVVGILVLAFINFSGAGSLGARQQQLAFSQVAQRSGSIRKMKIEPDGQIFGEFDDGTRFESRGPDLTSPVWADFMTAMRASTPAPEVDFPPPPAAQNLISLLSIIALPLMLFGLVYFLLLRPNMRR